MEKKFDLEKEALLASGVNGKDELAIYENRLHLVLQQFLSEISQVPDPLREARDLFTWLWTEKPTRYEPRGQFRLSDVIDAQLRKGDRPVGNCLGLTVLYNCLLRRVGVLADALYLDNAFGIGPHVLTLLQVGKSMIDIENILSDGFNYKGHLEDPSRTRWGDKELVADIYHSSGNEYFEKRKLNEALINYEMAIKLNPQYEKAHLNKVILLQEIGRGQGEVI
jgi:tetratricopeptide (TPR) repeat protein